MESCLDPSKEGQALAANIVILTNTTYYEFILDPDYRHCAKCFAYGILLNSNNSEVEFCYPHFTNEEATLWLSRVPQRV